MLCIPERRAIPPGQVAQLSQAQQLLYANLLLPGAPDDLQPPLQRQRVDDPAALIAPEDYDLDPDTASSQEIPNPMAGVRFASMTGPGPSGFRPEHVAAMLTCNRRRVVNRLMRAISEAQNFAAAGTLLAEGWAWVMDSRLIYIAKKS